MLSCCLLAFLPLAVSPEAEGVSSAGVSAWLDVCEREIDTVHGFVLLRHGKLVAEGSWAPFDTLNKPHRLSSHSKCFVTTAVGMLVDKGKLDLDECVIDILPDKAPASPSDNLKALRVRDLLTMTAGLKAGSGFHAGDWPRLTLAKPSDKKPGQFYRYDSDATYLLGVIVARKSGVELESFMRKNVFEPLGITSFWTSYDPDGIPCAGYGFNMSTRDIVRIGQLYLDHGMWNGRRIVSREWTELAMAKHTWSGKTPTECPPNNDWVLGFGFNFWRCQHGCYRADGAGGQYTILFPEHGAVLSINASVVDMQKLLSTVWDHFLPALSKTALPEAPAAAAALKERCAKLAIKPISGVRDGDDRYLGRTYAFKDCVASVRAVRIDRADGGWKLNVTTDAGKFDLPVGCGEWKHGEIVFSPHRYEKLGEIVGLQQVETSAAVQPDGSLVVRVQLLGGYFPVDLKFRGKLFKTAVDCSWAGRSVSSGIE